MRELISSIDARVRDAAILHGLVMGICGAFEVARACDDRFRRAISGFDACYQFRAGREGRWLRFGAGRVKTGRGVVTDADYELVLLDPVGVSKRFVDGKANDMLQLLLENKVEQRGNIYYLFKLGYLAGLCAKRVDDIAGVLRLFGPPGAGKDLAA